MAPTPFDPDQLASFLRASDLRVYVAGLDAEGLKQLQDQVSAATETDVTQAVAEEIDQVNVGLRSYIADVKTAGKANLQTVSRMNECSAGLGLENGARAMDTMRVKMNVLGHQLLATTPAACIYNYVRHKRKTDPQFMQGDALVKWVEDDAILPNKFFDSPGRAKPNPDAYLDQRNEIPKNLLEDAEGDDAFIKNLKQTGREAREVKKELDRKERFRQMYRMNLPYRDALTLAWLRGLGLAR